MASDFDGRMLNGIYKEGGKQTNKQTKSPLVSGARRASGVEFACLKAKLVESSLT